MHRQVVKLKRRNEMINKDRARLLAGIANSDFITKIMSDLLAEIEQDAILGYHSLSTTLLTGLDEPELKVIEHKIKKLGFTFEVKQTIDCIDLVVIGWEN